MLVIEVALAIFTLSLISQFLKVRLRQTLFMDRLYQIKDLGLNFGKLNSPEMISFTGLIGSLCTESKVC